MNKFNILYYLFLIHILVLYNNPMMTSIAGEPLASKPEEGTVEEKKGLKEIDLNKDGKINYYEFQQIRQRRFDRLDLNKDSLITQEEFEKRNQKFFLEVDENNDNFLSKMEMFKKRKKMKNILE